MLREEKTNGTQMKHAENNCCQHLVLRLYPTVCEEFG